MRGFNAWDLSERDSPGDQLVVTLFLLTVLGLLLGAGVKSCMEKAGIIMDSSVAWDTAHASCWWWEVNPMSDYTHVPQFTCILIL